MISPIKHAIIRKQVAFFVVAEENIMYKTQLALT